MSSFLQPILPPVKGAPDIFLSIDPNVPDELLVFLGMALLEKVPRLREHPSFKMLLARLYNGGVCASRLTRLFGVARSTLRRWGRALKSGDMDRIRKAFSGQGAEKKITPETESYIRDRFRDLYGQCRDYNRVIRAEVSRYFKVSVCSERLRWIFTAERDRLSSIPPARMPEAYAPDGEIAPDPRPLTGVIGANSGEMGYENGSIGPFLPTTRNDSLQLRGLPCSGRTVPEQPTLCHHAGVLLMSHWIDALTAGWRTQPDLLRQWVGQVLLGAVNHEQSKRLSFSSLDLIDEQYLRLDTRRKAFMDAIRISCRNIFCMLAAQFRPLYNNYRDDHFIVRELTHSSGIIHSDDGVAHVLLMPIMQFQPATRQIVQAFLAQISRQINEHFSGRAMPIHIQLLDENTNDLDIPQHGLRWVSSST